MSFLLVMNAGSRAGRGQGLWPKWLAGLQAAGAQFECAYTQAPGHARELSFHCTGHDTVVAVGGDGTINEVLDGIVASGNPRLRMGVLYSGTSPDFCKFHRIPLEPGAAVRALLAGSVRQVDVARIVYVGATGEQVLAHFGCSCNVGMGATIARVANRRRRVLGDVAGTGLGVVTALLAKRRVDLSLEVDGETVLLAQTNNLSVLKNPHLASELKLNLDVRPDDGRLWLVGVHGRSRGGMLRLLPGFYSGRVSAAPGLFVRSCQSVSIISATAQEIEFDGDPRGHLPARVELLARTLPLIGGTYD